MTDVDAEYTFGQPAGYLSLHERVRLAILRSKLDGHAELLEWPAHSIAIETFVLTPKGTTVAFF